MQQYFVNDILKINDKYLWKDDIGHHIVNVMRMKDGDSVRLVDDANHLFLASINLKDKAFNIIEEINEDRELMVDVVAIIALIKNDKFDMILQKLTELGVKKIVPLKTSRTIIKINDEKHKLNRWSKIVKEAAEQSKRTVVPTIESVIGVNEIDKYISDINYVAYENEQYNTFNFNESVDSISFIIGPEGGFSLKEIDIINSKGFTNISLGKRILRAETAAIFLMSNLVTNYEK